MRLRLILSETWNSLRHNGVMVISLLLVTFISFLFVGASVLTQAQVQRAQSEWYSQVEVVVWLCPDGTSTSANCSSGKSPSQDQIVQIEDSIMNDTEGVVSKITYVSKADFYRDTFLKRYPGGVYNGRTLTAGDMQDSLHLRLKDPSKYKVVSEVLSNKKYVESVEDQREVFDPIISVMNNVTVGTVILAVIMILVAILLTGTTIRLSAASRKTQTEIMRLVGASNWTIRMPFILEGVFVSLIGSLLSCLALGIIVKVFITDWAAKNVTWMTMIDLKTVLALSPFLVVGAVLLSIIASSVSLRRYLKA